MSLDTMTPTQERLHREHVERQRKFFGERPEVERLIGELANLRRQLAEMRYELSEAEERHKREIEALSRKQLDHELILLEVKELGITQKHQILPASVRLQDISTAVAISTGVSVPEIMGPSRTGDAVKARKMLCWLARKITAQSSTVIGRQIGRDHSTVLYAVESMDGMMQVDEALRHQVLRIMERLQGRQKKIDGTES